jgi:type IV secretory pathway TrbD component
MPTSPKLHMVYHSINKPLTIWGVERRLFFLALLMGSATFNFFGSLIGGIVMFAVLYLLARWGTASDPEMLRILFRSSKFKTRYDPAKHEVFDIRRILKHDKAAARS